MSSEQKQWVVYMLQCKDGSYYIGSTNDLTKRVATHNNKKGAKYTRSRLPVKLVYIENSSDRSTALKRELALKKLSHSEKFDLASKSSVL